MTGFVPFHVIFLEASHWPSGHMIRWFLVVYFKRHRQSCYFVATIVAGYNVVNTRNQSSNSPGWSRRAGVGLRRLRSQPPQWHSHGFPPLFHLGSKVTNMLDHSYCKKWNTFNWCFLQWILSPHAPNWALVKIFLVHVVSHSGIFGGNLWL